MSWLSYYWVLYWRSRIVGNVCVCVTHEINVRWLSNQIMPIAIILMICGARMKSLVHCQNIMSYSFWMIIEDYWNLRQSTNQKHNKLISFKHMYFFFLYLFLNLHTTIHHSNRGAHLRWVTGVGPLIRIKIEQDLTRICKWTIICLLSISTYHV